MQPPSPRFADDFYEDEAEEAGDATPKPRLDLAIVCPGDGEHLVRNKNPRARMPWVKPDKRQIRWWGSPIFSVRIM